MFPEEDLRRNRKCVADSSENRAAELEWGNRGEIEGRPLPSRQCRLLIAKADAFDFAQYFVAVANAVAWCRFDHT